MGKIVNGGEDEAAFTLLGFSGESFLELCWTLEERGMSTLDRITQTPGVMGGKACIRGMRVTVSMIIGEIGAGRNTEDVLKDFPYLEREDVLQALQYAALLAGERDVILASA